MSLEISAETTFLLDMVNTPFVSQYQTVYDSFTTKPSASIAVNQNTMVSTLVDGGVWAKVDVFYMFAQTVNSDSEALKNWINPGTNDSTLVNTPTFTSLEGFTGNGSNAYINTNYQPDTHKVNMSLDDVSIGVYCRTNSQESITWGVRHVAGEELRFAPRTAVDAFLYYLNSANSASGSNSDSRGMFVANRTASNAVEAFRNSGSVDTDTVASEGIPDLDFTILTYNSNGTPTEFSSRQVSMFFIGASLSSGEVTTLTNAVETYMDSNGKGVIT